MIEIKEKFQELQERYNYQDWGLGGGLFEFLTPFWQGPCLLAEKINYKENEVYSYLEVSELCQFLVHSQNLLEQNLCHAIFKQHSINNSIAIVLYWAKKIKIVAIIQTSKTIDASVESNIHAFANDLHAYTSSLFSNTEHEPDTNAFLRYDVASMGLKLDNTEIEEISLGELIFPRDKLPQINFATPINLKLKKQTYCLHANTWGEQEKNVLKIRFQNENEFQRWQVFIQAVDKIQRKKFYA